MVTIFASNKIDLTNITQDEISEEIKPKIQKLDEFKIEIHRIIVSFLSTKRQSLYSILNTKLSKVRKFYLSMRVKHLFYGIKKTKRDLDLFGYPLLDFKKYFNFLMKDDEVDQFFFSEKLPELMKYNGIREAGAKHQYTYNRSTGKIHWYDYDENGELQCGVPSIPLAIKFRVDNEKHIVFLRHYEIDLANFNKYALRESFISLANGCYGSRSNVFNCTFNVDSNSDNVTITNVKSVKWLYNTPTLERKISLKAHYIIPDNKLEHKRKRDPDCSKNLIIDGFILTDSSSSIKIIHTKTKNN
jgi:hypothetical protein